VQFWLLESLTPSILSWVGQRYPGQLKLATPQRPLLSCVRAEDEAGLLDALAREEQLERQADRDYWKPLRAELEQL
jgi:hypothetical protein